MPRDGYDDDRHGFDSNTRGRVFENGTDRYFPQNERNGYERGREIMTSLGPRRIDKSKPGKDGRLLSVEDKSGRVDSKHDARELAKDRELMERNIIGHHTIRTVQGEKMSKEVRELIDGMKRDFPDRFTHQVITREQAREIWALGLQREKDARQLALMSEQALHRRQRAAERLQRMRDAAERRERERKQREREDRQHRAAERLPKVREVAARLLAAEQKRMREERERIAREAAERVAREFGGIMQNIKRQDREAKEAREARETRALAELSGLNAYAEQVRQTRASAVAADQARLQEAAKAEERARLEREAIERERKQRELADEFLRTRLPPDVTDLLFKSRPTPGLERLHREHPSPGSTRGGRSERERLRERGRDGRERR